MVAILASRCYSQSSFSCGEHPRLGLKEQIARVARPEFEQKPLDVVRQRPFDFLFAARVDCSQEIEKVRVLEDLRRQIGIGGRERCREIGDRFALPLLQAAFDLQCQDIPGPAVLNGGLNIPFAAVVVRQLVQEQAVVKPG